MHPEHFSHHNSPRYPFTQSLIIYPLDQTLNYPLTQSLIYPPWQYQHYRIGSTTHLDNITTTKFWCNNLPRQYHAWPPNWCIKPPWQYHYLQIGATTHLVNIMTTYMIGSITQPTSTNTTNIVRSITRPVYRPSPNITMTIQSTQIHPSPKIIVIIWSIQTHISFNINAHNHLITNLISSSQPNWTTKKSWSNRKLVQTHLPNGDQSGPRYQNE